jgi:hypothetical protein
MRPSLHGFTMRAASFIAVSSCVTSGHLDEERALGALPRLLGDDDAARKATLDVLHRVLAARGDLSDDEKRRLTRVEALFGALPAKAAGTETAHA